MPGPTRKKSDTGHDDRASFAIDAACHLDQAESACTQVAISLDNSIPSNGTIADEWSSVAREITELIARVRMLAR